jgi:hypothetical protein
MSSSRTNVSKEVDSKGNESISYRKSWEKDGINHSKEVKKLEGGYLITEAKYGTLKGQGEESGEYIDERKEYISTTNPFNKKEDKEEKSDDEKLFGFIDEPTF